MKQQINEIKRMQELAGVVNESKYQNSLINEAFKSPEDAIEYLKNLALTGEFDKEAIDTLHADLLSARRKMFSNKRSPEQKSSSTQKSQLTRQLNKIKKKAQNEAEIEIGLRSPDPEEIQTATQAGQAIGLSIGSGPKNLQQKYNKIVIDKIEKAAREAGITDQEAIKDAYYYQDPTQWL
jgi:hypothetical protein